MVDNVVYILGAGFSAPLGIPVMSNFLEKSKDIFARDPETYKHFNNVFKTIDRMYKATGYFKADLFNIEEILSILEMSEELGDNNEKSLFTDYIIDVIKYYTPKLQTHQGVKSVNHWQPALFNYENNSNNSYGYFAGNLLGVGIFRNSSGDFFLNPLPEAHIKAKYSVITLNYDLVLENCFSYLQNLCAADKKLGFSNKDDKNNTSTTPLAKLHGSIENNNIVPPTWNKGLHREIKDAWTLAYKVLTQANHIRILGYSLPVADAYVKYLLKSAIINSEHLKTFDIVCLDTDGSVEKRYDEFVTFHKKRFKNLSIQTYLDFAKGQCINEGSNSDGLFMIGLEQAHKFYMESKSP